MKYEHECIVSVTSAIITLVIAFILIIKTLRYLHFVMYEGPDAIESESTIEIVLDGTCAANSAQ